MKSAPLRQVLTKMFGISNEVADDVMRIIANKGQTSNIRKHYARLSAVAKKRLQDALNNAVDYAGVDEPDEEDKEPAKEDTKAEKKEPAKEEKKDVKEAFTFMKFLLSEQVDATGAEDEGIDVRVKPEDIKNPEMRRDVMKQQRRQKNPAMKKRAIMNKIRELQQQLREL